MDQLSDISLPETHHDWDDVNDVELLYNDYVHVYRENQKVCVNIAARGELELLANEFHELIDQSDLIKAALRSPINCVCEGECCCKFTIGKFAKYQISAERSSHDNRIYITIEDLKASYNVTSILPNSYNKLLESISDIQKHILYQYNVIDEINTRDDISDGLSSIEQSTDSDNEAEEPISKKAPIETIQFANNARHLEIEQSFSTVFCTFYSPSTDQYFRIYEKELNDFLAQKQLLADSIQKHFPSLVPCNCDWFCSCQSINAYDFKDDTVSIQLWKDCRQVCSDVIVELKMANATRGMWFKYTWLLELFDKENKIKQIIDAFKKNIAKNQAQLKKEVDHAVNESMRGNRQPICDN